AVSHPRTADRGTVRRELRGAPAPGSRPMILERRLGAAAAGIAPCAGCAAWKPMRNTPPSASPPWAPPDPPPASARPPPPGHANDRGREDGIGPGKPFDRRESIDIAQRTNPEPRAAWEKARRAATAVGLAEGTYYPLLAATATGGAAHLAMPFPPNLIPGGL